MQYLKSAGQFCLGALFVMSCLPPLAIIAAIALLSGTEDRDGPADTD